MFWHNYRLLNVTQSCHHQILFVIAKPEVFKNPGSDMYIVFGDAKVCERVYFSRSSVLIQILFRLCV